MSCRSNAGNSAVTSYARITTGLSDTQTLSAFHALVREGTSEDIASPTRQEVEEWITRKIEQIRENETLTSFRRSSLINRLEAVRRPDALLPDGPTFYAWNHLDNFTNTSRRTLEHEFERLARVTRIPPELVKKQFEADRAAAEADSSLSAPPNFVERIGAMNRLWQIYPQQYYPVTTPTALADGI